MFNALINAFNPFAKPKPETIVKVELEEANRELLAAQSAAEYATAMVEYHKKRIQRLSQLQPQQAQQQNQVTFQSRFVSQG